MYDELVVASEALGETKGERKRSASISNWSRLILIGQRCRGVRFCDTHLDWVFALSPNRPQPNEVRM